MPTTRPRHMITETDEIAAALADAEKFWPDDAASRGRLLHKLILAGWETVRVQSAEHLAERLEAIRETAGIGTGIYEPGYLEELRKDWPE